MQILTSCSCCHQDFNVAENMIERVLDEKLTLTILVCPNCKNETVTQVDNAETLRVYNEQLVLLKHIGERKFKYGHATVSQTVRNNKLTQKLSQLRSNLYGKYNHTSYQFDGKEYKLDIHIPSMSISEE